MDSMQIIANFFEKHSVETLNDAIISVVRAGQKAPPPVRVEHPYNYSKDEFKRLIGFNEMLGAKADTARKFLPYIFDDRPIPDAMMKKYYEIKDTCMDFFAWEYYAGHQKKLMFYANAWTTTPKFQRADPALRYAALREISEFISFIGNLHHYMVAETVLYEKHLILSKN